MARPTLVHLWHVARHLTLTLVLPAALAAWAYSSSSLAPATASALNLHLRLPHRPRRATFNVVDFGAKGNGVDKDTRAIRDAIAAVAAAGSGVVLFPSGGAYLTGPFNVTSHCTLYLAEGATLLGSRDKPDWPKIPALPTYGQAKKGGSARRMSFIHGEHLEDFVLTGANGTVDVQGSVWQEHKLKDDTPPHLFEIMWSSDVEISHVTLRNSPFWTVHPYATHGFLVHDTWILNPMDESANDGIDPDSTSDVLIHDVYIRTGDDGIAIKSGWDEYGYDLGIPSRNITVRNVNITTTCAAVAIGSEMSGGVEDVLVEGSNFYGATAGVHIKSGAGRGGYVRNILFRDLRMEECFLGLMVDTDTDNPPKNDSTHHYNMSKLPNITNIRAENVVGRNSTIVAKLVGLAPEPITRVHLDSVDFDAGRYECGNVSGTWHDVTPTPCTALRPSEQETTVQSVSA